MKVGKNICSVSTHLETPFLNSVFLPPNSDPHLRLTARLITWLLFFRIPFYYGMFLLIAVVRPLKGFGSAIFLVATSVLVAILIWHERDHLQDYNIDKWAVGMFLVGKPIELVLILLGFVPKAPATVPLFVIYIIVAIWLFWALRQRLAQLLKTRNHYFRWIPVGIVLGSGFGMVAGFTYLVQSQNILPEADVTRTLTLGTAALLILYQAAYAGLSEEPLFRGFLWGYLRKLGWSENKILLSQAGLFAFAHVELLLAGWPISFALTFVGGVLLGWLVMRSRSISVSILSHGFANAVGNMITDYHLLDLLK